MANFNWPVNGGTVNATNPSVGLNTAVAPTSSTQIGGEDPLGDLQAARMTAARELIVNFDTGVTGDVNVQEWGGTPTTLGQKAMAASVPVVVASDQTNLPANITQIVGAAPSATNALPTQLTDGTAFYDARQIRALTNADVVTAEQGGTWNINNITGTVTLPTGAATEATLATLATEATVATLATEATQLSVETNTQAVADATTTDGAVPPAKVMVVAGSDGSNIRTVATTASGAVLVQGSGTPLDADVNVTEFGGNPVVTGTGASGVGIPRVTVSNDSNVLATQSGTWNINNITGTVSLPTGAATEATLATLATEATVATLATEATLSALNTKINSDYGVATGAVRTAAQIGNASGVADFNSGNVSAQTLRVVIVSDQPAFPTSSPINTTGSHTTSTVGAVAATLTAPANAVGFLLQASDQNGTNIRWAIGTTASATVGSQLQPGRGTGYVPCGANVSIISESGTNEYEMQWVQR